MELKTFSLDLGLLSDSMGVSTTCAWVYSACVRVIPLSGCLCVQMLVCVLYFGTYIHISISISRYTCPSKHMHMNACVSLVQYILRRLMINLCLTCLFTELLGGPSGVCGARNAANTSSNEKMQMIRLDTAPNP